MRVSATLAGQSANAWAAIDMLARYDLLPTDAEMAALLRYGTPKAWDQANKLRRTLTYERVHTVLQLFFKLQPELQEAIRTRPVLPNAIYIDRCTSSAQPDDWQVEVYWPGKEKSSAHYFKTLSEAVAFVEGDVCA